MKELDCYPKLPSVVRDEEVFERKKPKVLRYERTKRRTKEEKERTK